MSLETHLLNTEKDVFLAIRSISCTYKHSSTQEYVSNNRRGVISPYTCGLPGSTVPLLFDVSGVPSPFLLLSGSFAISVECLVSVFEKPSCLPDIVVVESPGVLAAAACKKKKRR